MDRRTLLAGTSLLPLAQRIENQATPQSSLLHQFSDIRATSMYHRSVQYDAAFDVEQEVISIHSWVCGYIAHPASRSNYRQFPNLFEDGPVDFELPGLPPLRSEFIERSAQIFGEDAALSVVTAPDNQSGFGAFAICLNGAMVQMLCIEPTETLTSAEAEVAARTIAESIQKRDPEFYGRGELTREIVANHTALVDDLHLTFPHVRVREDRYVFTQDDGISDFWE